MLVHRVFVVMSGSVDRPFDGYMYYDGSTGSSSGQTLDPKDLAALDAFKLTESLFTESRPWVGSPYFQSLLLPNQVTPMASPVPLSLL